MAQKGKMVDSKQLSRKELVIEAKDTVIKMLKEDEITGKSVLNDDDFQDRFDKHVDEYIAKGFNLDDSIELVQKLYNSILDNLSSEEITAK